MRRGNNNSGNRNLRGGGAFALARLLGEGMNRLHIERKIKEHTAPLIWAEVVGPQVASSTQIMKVADGVLHVSAKSAVWANELTFYKADILRRVNKRLNGTLNAAPVIKDILFQSRGVEEKEEELAPRTTIPRPSPEELDDVVLNEDEWAEIAESVATVADEGLRERFRRARITDARLKIWRAENGWLPCDVCGSLSPPRQLSDGTICYGEPDCPRCRVARRAGRLGR